jgi:hypothetical protein
MKGQGKDLEDPSGGGGGAKAFQKKFNKPALNRYGIVPPSFLIIGN